ncbi:PH domain-containing protein [Cryobacterium arcticum]|nr:PH domain-containing protein [Cryobacterium arcticum]
MSQFVGVILLALTVLLLVDAVIRGRWDIAALSLPALGLVAWMAGEVFLRPGIRVHDGGVTIVNPLHTIEVPWAAVDDLSTRFLVSVQTRSGRRIRAWGAPTAVRSRGAGRSDDPGRSSSAHRVLESYWEQHAAASSAAAGSEVSATRNWHGVAIGVSVALILVIGGQLLSLG